MKYSERLKDPRWQKKRLEVLSRDNWTCQHCLDTKSTLHVHHIAYGKEPWDVDNDLLITLCEDCHESEENQLQIDIPNSIQKLKESGFMSLSFYHLATVFKSKNRDWSKYEPAFSILKMAVEDDEIWNALEALFYNKKNK